MSARVLMCPPRHFEVRYAINPWMNRGAVDTAKAHAQWETLRVALARHAEVEMLEPVPGLPDLVFTANAGVVRGNVFVPTRFRHPERRGEEARFVEWFAARGAEVRSLPAGVIGEGAGDALVDLAREGIWMGYGFRSEHRAARALERVLDAEVHALRLIDPRFYHLDTCFSLLPDGGVMYWPGAFDERSLATIEAIVPPGQRIAVTEAEACDFSCNNVVLGSTVFVSRISPRLTRELTRRGFAVEAIAIDEFLKAGGGVRCLTLRLDVPAAAQGRREVA